MKYDLVYHGPLYDFNGLRKGTIAIKNSKIVIVRNNVDQSIKGEKTISVIHANNDVVAFPGFIDMHVHLRDYKQKYKETIETGTSALARGGITLACEMPNTVPPLDTVETITKRIEELSKRSMIEILIFAGPNNDPGENSLIIDLEKVAGFKIYPFNIHLLKTLPFRKLRQKNKLIVLHPEEPSMMSSYYTVYDANDARPLESEIWAVRHIGDVIANHVKIHITHITSFSTLLEARRYGFTSDTCPHYLLLNSKIASIKYCLAKVLPPLRGPRVNIFLKMAVQDGLIDAITSDHAPHSIIEKIGSPHACRPGINAGELTSGLLCLVIGSSYDLLYRYMSFNPAQILGLKNYGAFVPGYVGNITILDFSRTYRVRPSELHSLNKYSVYEGFHLPCDVVATIVRGRIIYSSQDSCEAETLWMSP